MTQIKWNELTPMQRDALIAEHVMGLRVERFPAMTGEVVSIPETPVIVDDQDIIRGNPAPYTTSMDAAWLAMGHFKQQGRVNTLVWELRDLIAPHLPMSEWPSTVFPQLTPERICIAALRAAGVEVIE